MRAKVYIEKTIPSYLAARPSRNLLVAARQQMTRDWWESRRPDFDLFVSQAVLEEAEAGDVDLVGKRLALLADIPVLGVKEGIMELAERFVAEGAIPERAAADGLHIAMATVYGCEYLLTWNCKHIANAEMQRRFRRVARAQGLELPVICTPEELMGEE